MAASNCTSVVVDGKLVISVTDARSTASRSSLCGCDLSQAATAEADMTQTPRMSCGSPNSASCRPARQITGVTGIPVSAAMYFAIP